MSLRRTLLSLQLTGKHLHAGLCLGDRVKAKEADCRIQIGIHHSKVAFRFSSVKVKKWRTHTPSCQEKHVSKETEIKKTVVYKTNFIFTLMNRSVQTRNKDVPPGQGSVSACISLNVNHPTGSTGSLFDSYQAENKVVRTGV